MREKSSPAKRYLSQAYIIDRRIKITLEKSERLRRSLYGRSGAEVGGSPNCSGDSLGRAVAKVIEYEQNADRLIDRLVSLRLEIERSIAELPDPIHREILERRYLLYQPWESHFDKQSGEFIKGIADDMGYSRRAIFEHHGQALKEFEKSALKCTEMHLNL
jgi:hypothetical protein